MGSSSRKQGLGGLHPYYSKKSTIDSSIASITHFGHSTQASALIDRDFFYSQLSEMATTLKEGIRTKICSKIREEIRDEINTLEDQLER